VARFDQQTYQFHRLVTRDTAGHAENDALSFVDLCHTNKLTDPANRRKLLEKLRNSVPMATNVITSAGVRHFVTGHWQYGLSIKLLAGSNSSNLLSVPLQSAGLCMARFSLLLWQPIERS
jgi:hypothetical protein